MHFSHDYNSKSAKKQTKKQLNARMFYNHSTLVTPTSYLIHMTMTGRVRGVASAELTLLFKHAPIKVACGFRCHAYINVSKIPYLWCCITAMNIAYILTSMQVDNFTASFACFLVSFPGSCAGKEKTKRA